MMKGENKMLTSREAFILTKAKQGMKPAEIQAVMPGEGFKPLTRPRIYQIIKKAGGQQ